MFEIPYAYYYEIDPTTGEFTQYEDLWDELSALIIPTKGEGESWTAPTDTVTGIKLSAETASILKGSSVDLTASVLPWTATDRSVTWTSDDESIATVDENGVVTGISAGTAVITATSNLDASFSASCEVTVTTLGITVNGTLQDADGNPMFYSWNMEDEETWTGGTAIDTSMTSATYNSVNDRYYIMDANDNSWSMDEVDPATGESIVVGTNAAGVPLWDMEYSTWLSTEEAAKINAIYYYYFLPGKDPMALDTSAFGLQSYLQQYSGASYLTAITSAGYYPMEEDDGSITDTELVIMLDNVGYIWYFWIYPTASGYGASLSYVPTDLDIAFPGDDSGNHMYSSMVVGEDGNLYLSAFTGSTNELFCLSLDEAGEMYNATRIGDVGADVWPATITSVTVNDAADAGSLAMVDAIDTISTVNVTAAELAAVTVNNTASVCTMDSAARAQKELTAVVPENPGVDAVDSTVTFKVISGDVSSFQVVNRELNDNAVEEPVAPEVPVIPEEPVPDLPEIPEIPEQPDMPAEPVVIASGWSGYTTWELTSDGVLTFTPTEEHLEDGQTNLKNYWKVNGKLTLPWGDYAEQITKVVIEDGIHDIGQMAFYELPNLVEVVLPASIVEIRNYAFKNCTSLTTINLHGVDFIREGAFYGCSALENVTFAEGVVIEDWAFSGTGVNP